MSDAVATHSKGNRVVNVVDLASPKKARLTEKHDHHGGRDLSVHPLSASVKKASSVQDQLEKDGPSSASVQSQIQILSTVTPSPSCWITTLLPYLHYPTVLLPYCPSTLLPASPTPQLLDSPTTLPPYCPTALLPDSPTPLPYYPTTLLPYYTPLYTPPSPRDSSAPRMPSSA